MLLQAIMNESREIVNDHVAGGVGDVGNRVVGVRGVAGLRVAAAGAPSPEDTAGAEHGLDGEGYQVVTRARGKKGINGNAGKTREHPIVFRFDQPPETSRKRRAEEHLETADKETGAAAQYQSLKSLIIQLVDQNEERTRESERQMQEIRILRKEVEELKVLIENADKAKPSYASAVTKGIPNAPTAGAGGVRSPTGRAQAQRVRLDEDKCAITINTSRFKGEKADFAKVKASLQEGIDAFPNLRGIKVRCLRQLPGERINVVFQTEAEAERVKGQSRWLAAVMPQASVKSDAWFPVKCDMVVKRAVIDEKVEGGRTLRKEVCAEFAIDNRHENIDFTALRASWLSKMNPWKKTGSLVVWLKSKLAADHLLEVGQALFGGGAYGAFCSRYEPSTADRLCFNCNTYGHLQGTCKKATKCGKCCGAHQSRECTSQDPPRCAVCAGTHRSSDWQCKRHPYHKRYMATQAAQAVQAKGVTEARPENTSQDIEMGHHASEL